MYKRKFITYSILILLVLFSGCNVHQSLKRNRAELNSELFSFDFTLENKTIGQRVHFLDSLGFAGVTCRVNSANDVLKLVEYQKEICSKTNNRLKIPAVFGGYNVQNRKSAIDLFKSVANQLKGTKTAIWVIVNQPKNGILDKNEVVSFFKEIAAYADKLKLSVVIYPHDKTYIESAKEALWYVKETKCNNLFLSFHLCHELRAGNANRMNEAIAEVAPYIKMASICGADSIMEDNTAPGYWYDAIKPLSKGNYDTSFFLECLIKNGYRGPIALHTFGLKEPVNEHFSLSIDKWKEIKREVSVRLNKNEK